MKDMTLEALNNFRRRHPRKAKIANNTWLRGSGTDSDPFVITLHVTDIVTVTPGTVAFNTGGWKTVTTKERMHRAMPAGCFLFQKDWQWFVQASPSAEPVAVGDTFRLELRDGRWAVIA
jgi:hypothetical protein